MTKDNLIACVRRLHRLQAIYLTFQTGPGSITALRRLIALVRSNPAVRIDQGIMIGLLAVTQSGEWQRVNRTIAVYGMMFVKNDEFTDIAQDLESVSAGDHIASKLFTSNPRKKQQVIIELTQSIASDLFVNHIKDWGCTMAFDLVDLEGLPGMKFTINSADDHGKIVEVILDGFSGRMAVDGTFGDIRCSDPDQVRKVIADALVEKLENMTAS